MFEEDGGQVEADVVEEHEVLVELAHVADVRDDGDTELFAHQAHGEEFADSGDADGIHLDEPGTFHLEVVLEDDSVRNVLAEREFHWSDGIGEGFVADDVVRVRGFLDPERIDFLEAGADVERLG